MSAARVRRWPLDIATAELLHAAKRVSDCLPASSGRSFTRLHPQMQEALTAFRRQLRRFGPITFTTLDPEDIDDLDAYFKGVPSERTESV